MAKAAAKPRRAAKTRPAKKVRVRKKKGFIRKALGPKPTTPKKGNWAWRVVKGTTKGTAKFAAKQTGKAVRKGAEKVKTWKDNRDFESGYVPEPGEIPKGRRTKGATYVGDKKFSTPAAAMAYSEKVAAAEPVVLADRARTTVTFTKWGTARVAPATRPTAKKKTAKKKAPKPKDKTDALIKAHRDKLTKIGSVAVAENEVAKFVKKAFQELFDHKPRRLSQMEQLALGMEQADAYAAEVVESLRMFYIQRGFDPALLMALNNVQSAYEVAAEEWTKHIVVIKDELAAEIAAAKRRREGAAGNVPSDETLAG
ncbi:hypothetical protein [Actinophytocola sp.]|uniref:hypothetical protein n=1 Tax=Actinophytocola sp. TaxID=1872138 RepID=UPI002D7EBD25|nr:hypothetical protein [Actinophytocola sp.]HET9144183.1 hypothetical protein [Actinophytocola sp.]